MILTTSWTRGSVQVWEKLHSCGLTNLFYEYVTKETWAVGFSITVAYPFWVSYTLSHRVYRWLIIICTTQVTVTQRWGDLMIAVACTWRSEALPSSQWTMVCVNHRTQSHISTHPKVYFPLTVLPLTTLALSCFLTCAAGGIDSETVGLVQ